jgi:hypothetical protein
LTGDAWNLQRSGSPIDQLFDANGSQLFAVDLFDRNFLALRQSYPTTASAVSHYVIDPIVQLGHRVSSRIEFHHWITSCLRAFRAIESSDRSANELETFARLFKDASDHR